MRKVQDLRDKGEDGPLEAGLIINGRRMSLDETGAFELRDPVLGAVVTRAASGSPGAARSAANAAAAAFPDWSSRPFEARAACLLKAAEDMRARQEEVVEIAASETGALPEWVRFNVDIAVNTLRQVNDLAPAFAPMISDAGERVSRKPAGIVLGFAPWNAPVTLAVRAVASPLACGNTAILKGSPLCPKTHEWVAETLIEAGLPDGVLNFITCAPDQESGVVEALIGHPGVRRINFTGSTRIGREIALMAAQHLKPCLLELSGKGTMIILADADLKAAAEATVFSGFFNSGQVCMSTERLLVEDSVAEPFALELLRAVKAAPETQRLVSPDAEARVRGLIEDALALGATLVCGSPRGEDRLAPTILDHVQPGMRCYGEEIFGPVLAMTRVADAEEAVALANDTDFGLVASVFSADVAKAEAMLAAIDVGVGHVNGPTVYDDPRYPFGGVKASGYGRFGGMAAVHEFTETQWTRVHASNEGPRNGA